RIVGEADGQWVLSVSRTAGKAGRRRYGPGAEHGVGAAAVIARAEDHNVAETGGIGWRETDHHVSRTRPRQGERRARQDGERPAIHPHGAIALGRSAPVRYHKARFRVR